MSFIGAVIAITCIISGNLGGAVLAIAIGVAIDTVVIDIIGVMAILITKKEIKSEGTRRNKTRH